MAAVVVGKRPAFVESGWKNHEKTKLEFDLCHSIEVCGRRPPWVANEMCSNVLSVWKCSKSAANGKRASALPACVRPKRRLKPVRIAERGVDSHFDSCPVRTPP